MSKRWYKQTSAHATLIVVTLGGVLMLSAYWIGQRPLTEVRTELVLSQTALAVPGAVTYGNGQFSIEIDEIPGNVRSVAVRVVGPEGLRREWEQGLGRKTYRYGSDEFFVDILSVMDDETSVTDVTVSVVRKR